MSKLEQIPDERSRRLAETTFDRNVVVVAGAGTGKTTLLVNRLVNLLMKEPDPVPITHIVALTFTNKAATEMKVKLRACLSAYTDSNPTGTNLFARGYTDPTTLGRRYHLAPDKLASRAEAALHDLEKAQIGTLHSFAAHLLRLHPLESGVDPAFQEDDGLRFDEHFTTQWDLWLDRELGQQGTHHVLWRRLLSQASLDQLRDLARSLCSELVDLDDVNRQIEATHLTGSLHDWLARARARAGALLAVHDRPRRRKIELMLAAAQSLFGLLVERGPSGMDGLPQPDRDALSKKLGDSVAGWEGEDFAEADRLIGIAQRFLSVDQSFFHDLLGLLIPFVMEVRQSFVAEGLMSFDGLLARARSLLRDHPSVRDRIKRDYRAVLVDEFQDTDPVQYEIMLYVSEQAGCCATTWQEIELAQGKLFIVGDPKQSIYAFRRADIEAFDRVVRKIEDGQGVIHTLTTNFRSDGAVLDAVNDVFDRLFHRREHIQPANVRLEVQPNRKVALSDRGVRLRLVTPAGDAGDFDAAAATRAEAEALARWLKEDVLSRASINLGHIALLFRKLTQVETYLDALRRHGIPYVTDGEKHFYRRQEVIDLVNLLRVLENPHDAIAMVGLLRSPLGGLPDRDLYELRLRNAFDYRNPDRLASWDNPNVSAVRRLYDHLADLYRLIQALPLPDGIQLLFDRLPVLELAASSLHGEQAVANLAKVRQTAAALADRPHLTLSGFVDLMVARLDEQPDEAESAQAEESLDAVRVLTIHKAKGLEFPIVVLPGLHQGAGRDRKAPPVAYDWSSGAYGLALGDRYSLGAVLVHEKQQAREEAERRRVLYVGMTRAKDLLILSGGLMARTTRENVLALLEDIGEGEIGAPETHALTVGQSAIPHTVIEAPERKRHRRQAEALNAGPLIDDAAVAQAWQRRNVRWGTARATPVHVTPTALMAGTRSAAPGTRQPAGDRDRSLLAGILAHRVLEQWDYRHDPTLLAGNIRMVCACQLPPELEQERELVEADLQTLFSTFARSDAYRRLTQATIIGREVPFSISWEGDRIMSGVIDLLYRLDGKLWIADYKTDDVLVEELPARIDRYREQVSIYRKAVTESIGQSVAGFHLIFVRRGILAAV